MQWAQGAWCSPSGQRHWSLTSFSANALDLLLLFYLFIKEQHNKQCSLRIHFPEPGVGGRRIELQALELFSSFPLNLFLLKSTPRGNRPEICLILHLKGFPGGASGKEPARQCRRHKRCRFEPWFGKILWRKA